MEGKSIQSKVNAEVDRLELNIQIEVRRGILDDECDTVVFLCKCEKQHHIDLPAASRITDFDIRHIVYSLDPKWDAD